MTTRSYQIDAILARWQVRGILLSTALGLMLARLFRWMIPSRGRPSIDEPQRILIAGSFYNDAWFDSHVAPLLAAPPISEVLVVTDQPLAAREGVRFCCPSARLQKRIGRIPARWLCILRHARKYQPMCLIGYHIMPNALMCLLAGRWLGLPAIYQMTGGPVQLIDGGIGSENALLRRQVKPGRLRARLMHYLAQQFDQIIVRGKKARAYLFDQGVVPSRIHIIPGTVPSHFFDVEHSSIRYDLIAVGRLVDVKRYDHLLAIVAELAKKQKDIRCAIAGDGPLLDQLTAQAADLEISDRVKFLGKRTDIAALLAQARAYILTSDNEGLSIAMMEAMAAGLPAIVPNIGELGELLVDHQTGVFVDTNDIVASAARIEALLFDDDHCRQMGQAARAKVQGFAAVDTVADRWDQLLSAIQLNEAPTATDHLESTSRASTAVSS